MTHSVYSMTYIFINHFDGKLKPYILRPFTGMEDKNSYKSIPSVYLKLFYMSY